MVLFKNGSHIHGRGLQPHVNLEKFEFLLYTLSENSDKNKYVFWENSEEKCNLLSEFFFFLDFFPPLQLW